MEIKIDKTTLPKDNQLVVFKTMDLETFEGVFIESESIFVLDDGKFFSVYDTVEWIDKSELSKP